MTALVVLLGASVALLAVLVVGLLRSHADILRALHDLGVDLDGGSGRTGGLPTGASPAGVAPPRAVDSDAAVDLAGSTPSGDAIAVGVSQPATMTLLAFLSSGCLTCREFWDAFRDPGSLRLPASVRLVAVTKGSEMDSPSRIAELAGPALTVVMSSDAWVDYGIQVSPYFVLVDGDRAAVVGEGSAATWGQVRSLLDQALAEAPGGRPRRPSTDAERERLVDEQLTAAGIEPGDPRLHQHPGGS
jgi:hypothetical protein